MGQIEETINDSLPFVLDSLKNTAKVCVTKDTVEVISQSQRQGLEWHSFFVFVAFLLFILVLVTLYGLASKRVKKCTWNLVHKCLHVIFVVTWISGFCLYCVGMHVPVDNSILAVAPMAIIHATEMFVGMSDISAIHADCMNSAAYMIWFGFSHLLAVIVSLLFLFRQFGHHITSWLRLRWISKCSRPKHLYVFWGQNERSYLLARDILKNRVAGERLVMIRTFDDQKEGESKMSFSKQFEMMKMSNREFEQLTELDCCVATSLRPLYSLDYDVLNSESECKILRKTLGLKSLARLVKRSERISFFFLGQDGKTNVTSVLNLLCDVELNSVKSKVTVFCHARDDDAKTLSALYQRYSEDDFKVQVLDSSKKAIECLESDRNTHPVRYMNVDTAKAAVKTPFNALIVGFGEVGQEALNYLYEFSALPDEDGNKMPVHITMIDECMETLEGNFRINHSWFDNNDKELTFEKETVGSVGYVELLKKLLDDLNYVVVSLDDDELSMKCAVQLFELAFHKRKRGFDDFSIYVKSFNQDNYDRMRKLADSLNSSVSNVHDVLKLFGSEKDIYTKDRIINELVLKNAMKYHLAYEGGDCTAEDKWRQSFGKLKLDKQCRLAAIKENETKSEQNISNYMHIGTKMALLGVEDNNLSELAVLMNEVKTRKESSCVYDVEKDEQRRLINVAKCEHLRWMASHIMMGFVYGAKNYQTMEHNCLVSWDELGSDETRSYDCRVVDVSIRICLDRLLK